MQIDLEKRAFNDCLFAIARGVPNVGHLEPHLRSYVGYPQSTCQAPFQFVFENYIKADGVRSILDVGCGVGLVAIAFAMQAGKIACGVDASYLNVGMCYYIKGTQENGRALTVEFKQADAHALPFKDGEFDVCYSGHFLEHVREPVTVLREMRRVAARAVCGIVPLDHASDSPDHLSHFDYAGLLNCLIEADLRKPVVSTWPERLAFGGRV